MSQASQCPQCTSQISNEHGCGCHDIAGIYLNQMIRPQNTLLKVLIEKDGAIVRVPDYSLEGK